MPGTGLRELVQDPIRKCIGVVREVRAGASPQLQQGGYAPAALVVVGDRDGEVQFPAGVHDHDE